MRKICLPIAALAMTLLALGTGADALVAQGGKPHDHHKMMIDQCAVECSKCQRECDSCGAHCAKMLAEGKKEHIKTLRTCQDCATHCGAAACIISRNGPFSDLICKACAEACARCGKACTEFKDDAHMKQCADECKKCEKACRDMLAHMKTTTSTSISK
jgi:hypothetical protein